MRTSSVPNREMPGCTALACGLAVLLMVGMLALPNPAAAEAPDPRHPIDEFATPPASQEAQEPGGVDWPSVAVGAGAAMAVVAIGGAAVLTVRRRHLDDRSMATSGVRDPRARTPKSW